MTTPNGDQGTGPATGSGDAQGGTDPQVTDGSQQDANGSVTEGDKVPVSKTDLAREVEKWKALSRKNELRAKENSTAAKKLQDLEDANKSEFQKAQERAAKAEADVLSERAERHRLLAAATNGLGPDFISYLGGGEETEIFERAETLAKTIQSQVDEQVKTELAKYGIAVNGQAGTAPTAAGAASLSLGRRPVESLRPGSAPANGNAPANANDAFRQMLGR